MSSKGRRYSALRKCEGRAASFISLRRPCVKSRPISLGFATAVFFFMCSLLRTDFSTASSLSRKQSSDYGGNRGWALGFNGKDQFASNNGYFNTESYWPQHHLTVSAWVRLNGIDDAGRQKTCVFSLIASGDTNHVQPFFLEIPGGSISTTPSITYDIAMTSRTVALDTLNVTDIWTYWTKLSLTYTYYNSTYGSISHFYINGTLVDTYHAAGAILRFSDSTMLTVGGYALGDSSLMMTQRFIGWIDDLTFYNYIKSPAEIAATWNKVANTSDPGLVIYYNFDEGPGATVINNLGRAGSQADLYNGKVFGNSIWYDTYSSSLRKVSAATWVPGSPVIPTINTLPITVSVDATQTMRIHISCHNTSVQATHVNITSFNASLVNGRLYEAPIFSVSGNDTKVGSRLVSFPIGLTNPSADVMYRASSTSGYDIFEYRCKCGSSWENGTVEIVIASTPVADTSISLTAVTGTAARVILGGTQGAAGYLQSEVTALPTLGSLYQMNFSSASGYGEIITTVPTVVANPLNLLVYLPYVGQSGSDSISFIVYHDGIASAEAQASIAVTAWDNPPSVSTSTSATILNRKATTISLTAVSLTHKEYVGVYITSLPKKGKLYQVNTDDGSRGAEITQAYSPYTSQEPLLQYATAVANVSSFWGGSLDYSPKRALGPQDCYSYGDCPRAWCPLTLSGTGGFASGSGQGLTFANNPDVLYDQYGYTEYLELTYNQSVHTSQLLIGENRGVGAIKNIKAKDPYGQWMPLYAATTNDGTTEALYSKFSQYRYFEPTICSALFPTRHLRFEMDTRDVPDWHEYDFFQMGGPLTADPSMVNWNGESTWEVIYVPDDAHSGLDTFTYIASDCPTQAQHWSGTGKVSVNIVPVGVAASITVDRTDPTYIDLKQWSVSNSSAVLTFTVTALPSSSTHLKSAYGDTSVITAVPTAITNSTLVFVPDGTCAVRATSFSYQSSDSLQPDPVEVLITVDCPRDCAASDLTYTVSSCGASGFYTVKYAFNETTISSGSCIPGSSFPLPSDYSKIPCGEVSTTSATAAAVFFFVALVCVLGLVFIGWLAFFPHLSIVKLSQPGHSAVYCIGGMWLQASWISYLGPITSNACMVRPWLLGVSYSLMFGALVRKIFVVMNFLYAAKHMKKSHASSKSGSHIWSVLTVFWCILVDVVILVSWTAYSPMVPTANSFLVPNIGHVIIDNYACGSEYSTTFTTILIAWKAALTAYGAFLAFRVRSLDSVVGESAMMLYCTYNLVVCGFLLIIITFVADVAPEVWTAITAAISCFAVLFAMCVLFVPKMYMHWTGKLVNAQEIFGKAIQNHSSGDKSSSRSTPAAGAPGGGTSDLTNSSNRHVNRSDIELADKSVLVLSTTAKGMLLDDPDFSGTPAADSPITKKPSASSPLHSKVDGAAPPKSKRVAPYLDPPPV